MNTIRQSTGFQGDDVSLKEATCNYDVVRLVLFGFATAAIARETGLTRAQVQSRVKLYNLQGVRSMFRKGYTENAEEVMRLARRVPKAKKQEDHTLYHAIRNKVLETCRIKSNSDA